jgi:DNA-binding MarR family transcriptional regulator
MADPPPQPQVRVGPGFEQAWAESSAVATECVLNLYRLVAAIDSRVQRIARAHGVPSVAALNVLAILRGAGQPLTPSVIADELVVTRGNVTGILRSLQQRGLVRRHVSPTDRRILPVELTAHGAETIDALQAVLHRSDRELLQAIPTPQHHELRRILATLQTAVTHSYQI